MKKLLFAVLLLVTISLADVIPDLKFQSLDKVPTSLYKEIASNEATVVSLVTLSCPWCRKEINDLNELEVKFKNKKVGFIVIYFDQNIAAVKERVKQEKLMFPAFVGGDAFAEYFKLRGVPFNVIIDKNKQIVQQIPGYIPKDGMESYIQSALR